MVHCLSHIMKNTQLSYLFYPNLYSAAYSVEIKFFIYLLIKKMTVVKVVF